MIIQLFCFGTMAVVGGGYLLLAMGAGDVGDAVEGVMESVDGLLEGLDINIIPDSWFSGSESGPGSVSVLAAFLAGFGGFGLLATLGGKSVLASIGLGLISGLILAVVLGSLLKFLHKQQATSVVSDKDFLGLSVQVIANVKPGEIGQGIVDVKNQRLTRGIREIKDKAMSRNDRIEVIEVRGGVLFVKKL
jgi:membrane protein implicated in regulation of membrane protease activity